MSSTLAEDFLRFSESERTAVWDETTPWTYRHLYRQTARAASFYRAHNVRSLAIGLPQGPEAYAAIWAAYLAGVVFCPLHPGVPEERLRQILLALNPDASLGLACSNDISLEALFSPENKEDLLSAPMPQEIAYIMFTSGSTGTPKGVLVARDSLEHVTKWSVERFFITREAVWAQYSTLGFDLSLLDIFCPLSAGASIVPFTTLGQKLRPAERLKRAEITHWHSVPSVFDLVARSNDLNVETLQSLRYVLFCGEPLYRAQVRQLLKYNPQLTIYNNYGPTEATIFVSSQRVSLEDIESRSAATIALGAPVEGNWFEVLGVEDEPRELVICGRNVALGYLGAEQGGFFSAEDGTRTFRTGDFCTGEVHEMYFEGRRDSQIKVAGHRLDLCEIDSALRALGITACASIHVNHDIIAFVAGSATEHPELRDDLRKYLPSYAMPKRFVFLPSLPYTPAGKIDRLSLGQLAASTQA